MKKLSICIMTIICCLLASMTVSCDNGRIAIPRKPVILKPKKGTSLPNNPGGEYLFTHLDGYYCNGYIEIVIPDEVVSVTVYITDDEALLWSGTLTREHPSSEFPEMPAGQYDLYVTTSYGDTYGEAITL